LLAGHDKRAVPALLALLTDGSPELAARAEELLYCLAGTQAPRITLGGDPATRKRCRSVWEQWWRLHEKGLDLAKSDVDLLPNNRSLQARAVAQRFAEAVFHGDETALRQLVALPFTATGKKVYTEREELEQEVFNELNDGSTGQRARFTLGPILALDDLRKLLGTDERNLLNTLRKPENRIVVIRAEVGGETTALCPVIRESKQGMHVIGLVRVSGPRQP
jgi:hypothetical protein